MRRREIRRQKEEEDGEEEEEEVYMNDTIEEVVLSFPEKPEGSIDLPQIEWLLNRLLLCFRQVKMLYVENARLTRSACAWCLSALPPQATAHSSLSEILLKGPSVEAPSPEMAWILRTHAKELKLYSSETHKGLRLSVLPLSPSLPLERHIFLLSKGLLNFLIDQRTELFSSVLQVEKDKQRTGEEDRRNGLGKFLERARSNKDSNYICQICHLERYGQSDEEAEEAAAIWAILPCGHPYHADCFDRHYLIGSPDESKPVCANRCFWGPVSVCRLFSPSGARVESEEEEVHEKERALEIIRDLRIKQLEEELGRPGTGSLADLALLLHKDPSGPEGMHRTSHPLRPFSSLGESLCCVS